MAELVRHRVLAIGLLVLGASRAASAGGPATDAYASIREGALLDVHGLLDLYVLHGFNAPASSRTELRAFDDTANQPALGLLRVTLAHRPRRFGFRLDVGAGDTADAFKLADPANSRHPDLSRALSWVEQAFLSVVIPVGKGLSVDAGKFGTPFGIEDNESVTNWSYSRSLLYTLAEPALHTGLRLTYQALPALAFSLCALNGWNSNVLDGSGLRSYVAAASYKPRDGLELVLVYLGGLERAPSRLSDPHLSWRHALDAYVSLSMERFSWAVCVDYGHDAGAGGVDWWGGAGYSRLQILRWLAVALRGEYLSDGAGYLTGTPQQLVEGTATLELRGDPEPVRFVARLEYRHDQSTARAFPAAGPGTGHRQDTLALALLTWF